MRAHPSISLRAQLAWLAAAASLLTAALAVAILVPSVGRATGEQARADAAVLAETLAAAVVRACVGNPERLACERRELDLLWEGGSSSPRIAVGERPPLVGPRGAFAQLEGGELPRWIVVERSEGSTGSGRVEAITRLGIGLALLDALLLFVFLYFALVRTVAKPADRLLAAIDRVGSEAPLFSEEGPVLGRLGVAFDRMGTRLSEERRTVEAQVVALREANRSLAEARESAIRQEKLATVGQLAAGVAHEIGNPLAALLGYMQLIRGRSEARALESYVEPMEHEARRIDRILRDLLDFARPARSVSGPAVALVQRTIERTARLLEPQKRFHHVEIQLDLAADLPPVRAEEHQLGQVLVNLFLNAADAMGGGGRIAVSARQEGDRVILTVRDTGPGIAPDQLPHLFDPFFTTKSPGEGTGLGLSICHSLVESFGGSITAANVPGGGAQFRIELPIVPDSLPQVNPRVISCRDADSERTRRR